VNEGWRHPDKLGPLSSSKSPAPKVHTGFENATFVFKHSAPIVLTSANSGATAGQGFVAKLNTPKHLFKYKKYLKKTGLLAEQITAEVFIRVTPWGSATL
jgi:hypothetical protein